MSKRISSSGFSWQIKSALQELFQNTWINRCYLKYSGSIAYPGILLKIPFFFTLIDITRNSIRSVTGPFSSGHASDQYGRSLNRSQVRRFPDFFSDSSQSLVRLEHKSLGTVHHFASFLFTRIGQLRQMFPQMLVNVWC